MFDLEQIETETCWYHKGQTGHSPRKKSHETSKVESAFFEENVKKEKLAKRGKSIKNYIEVVSTHSSVSCHTQALSVKSLSLKVHASSSAKSKGTHQQLEGK